MRLAAGVALAAAASLLYNLGLVVQTEAARREAQSVGLDAALVARLFRRTRWLAGTILVAAGWPFQAAALAFAPLTVVQPTLAVGLFVPLLAATRLGDRVRSRDVRAVAAVAAGVSLVVAAAPARETHWATGPVVAALALLAAAAVAATTLVRAEPAHGAALVVGAGLAFAGGALVTKLVADAATARSWVVAAVAAVLAIAAGLLGTTAQTGALQRRSAGGVAAVVFSLETVLPVALAPVLFGERWSGSAGGAAVRVAGLALAIAGAVDLAATHPAEQISATSS
jgi:drug/metabolite transporter (DMT)-like permease